MTLEIRVPVESGDVELFGGDPYRSARSWHTEAMRLREVLQKITDGIVPDDYEDQAPQLRDMAEAALADMGG